MRNAEYREVKKHGTQNFPMQFYYLDWRHPRYVMPVHWHNEVEMIRVLKGSLAMFVDNIEYNLGAGDILLVEGGCLLRGVPADCVYECIVFDPNMLKHHQNYAADKYITPIIEIKNGFTCQISKESGELYSVIAGLFDTMRDCPPYFELKVYALLFEMFYCLHSKELISSKEGPYRSQKAKNISCLLDWVEENLSSKITLDELAEMSGFNKKYLCRIFKEYTSKTIVEYITELRIGRACYELAEGKSVTEAALESGFDDLSYFCKVFKRAKGLSPKEYKKNHESK